MSSTTNADGTTGGTGDLVAQLSRMSNRTSLMVIDATLNALRPAGQEGGTGYADAAAEVRALAKRMVQATADFQATVCQPAE